MTNKSNLVCAYDGLLISPITQPVILNFLNETVRYVCFYLGLFVQLLDLDVRKVQESGYGYSGIFHLLACYLLFPFAKSSVTVFEKLIVLFFPHFLYLFEAPR